MGMPSCAENSGINKSTGDLQLSRVLQDRFFVRADALVGVWKNKPQARFVGEIGWTEGHLHLFVGRKPPQS